MCLPYIEYKEHLITFHLQNKHAGSFANRKYEKLSYPKIQKSVRRPHSSNSIDYFPIPHKYTLFAPQILHNLLS